MQNAWREFPETDVGGRHILGVLRLALIPLRGTRAALRMTRYKQVSPTETFTDAVQVLQIDYLIRTETLYS